MAPQGREKAPLRKFSQLYPMFTPSNEATFLLKFSKLFPSVVLTTMHGTDYLILARSIVIGDAMKRFEAGQSPLPVYFYCSRSAAEPERSNSDAVLASILRQLSCVQPGKPLLPPVIEKYKKQGEGFSSNGLQLEESRELVIELIGSYGITTIGRCAR